MRKKKRGNKTKEVMKMRKLNEEAIMKKQIYKYGGRMMNKNGETKYDEAKNKDEKTMKQK